MRQAIIWTHIDPINWRIYAALGGDELICSNPLYIYTLWYNAIIVSQYIVYINHTNSTELFLFDYSNKIQHTLQMNIKIYYTAGMIYDSLYFRVIVVIWIIIISSRNILFILIICWTCIVNDVMTWNTFRITCL